MAFIKRIYPVGSLRKTDNPRTEAKKTYRNLSLDKAMSESSSTKIRFVGSCAGLVVGLVLGMLVGMGFNNIFFGAVIGGSIGAILGFCFPNVASYILGGLIDIP